MKKSDWFSIGAAVLGGVALIISLSQGTPNRSAERTAELRALVDASVARSASTIRLELVERLDGVIAELGLGQTNPVENANLAEVAQLARTDPHMAKMLRDGIESIILQEMADELAAVDWQDVASGEEIQKVLKKALRGSTFYMSPFHKTEPVDVSDIEGVDNKVDRILEEFEGLNRYTQNNALVKQMVEMGDEAIAPLLERMGNGSYNPANGFALNMAITESLEKLLTEEHEEIILEEFTKHGHFASLIEKYQFPAAEDEVMNKIAYPSHGHVNNDVVDAALKMNPERSIPILIDYVNNGQNVSYAAEQLSAEGIEITEPLRNAAARANHTWQKAQLAELCLDRDMPEGYDLAIAVLRSNEQHAQHSQDQLFQYIRKYTGLNGSYDEVADWLEANRP